MSALPRIERLDHLVLTVADIDITVAFYARVLGMRRENFGAGRVALRFGAQKINLHQVGREFEPRAARPTPGSGDLCFIAEGPLEAALDHVRAQGVEILEGPVARTGATGPITSFYFRDPDENLIEVATYAAMG
jgi:catechol 2,3-dioxygenase-like lactoylglutathione lyase family enzyme